MAVDYDSTQHCNSVSELSKFLANPGQAHMDAAMMVLRYLKGTSQLGLRHYRNGGSLEGFANSDWASCKDIC